MDKFPRYDFVESAPVRRRPPAITWRLTLAILLILGFVGGFSYLVANAKDIFPKLLNALARNRMERRVREIGNRLENNMRAKRYDKVIADCDRLAEMVPAFRETALYTKGVAQAELRRFDDAIATYGKLLKLNPSHASGLNNRAYTMSLRGGTRAEMEQALKDVEAAIRLEPNSAYLDTRACVLSVLGRQKEALAAVDAAIAAADDEPGAGDSLPELRHHRGLIRRALGEAKLAEEDLTAARHLGFKGPVLVDPLPASTAKSR